ncbi:MAG: ChaN family lipoprotein [Acidobacteriota bacterium]
MSRIWLRVVLYSMILLSISTFGFSFESGYIPHRVFHSDDKKYSDFEAMLNTLATVDVLFVGEQHDDPATHKFELAILEGLARRNKKVIVAMEMFERDVQKTLTAYLTGKISEEEFLKNSRPWGNYPSDYRPIIEFAKAKGWPVIASNVPRKYASQIARGGLPVLEKLPENERGLIAKEINAPNDDYFKNFSETMKGHPGADGKTKEPTAEDRAMIQRIYEAQCTKDDTMAESIAETYQNAGEEKPIIVHYNGAFHSDFRLGTASRTAKRLPKAKVRVVSVVAVEDVNAVKADDYRKRGDFILFAYRPAKPKSENK